MTGGVRTVRGDSSRAFQISINGEMNMRENFADDDRPLWIPKSLVSDEDHYRPEYVIVWMMVAWMVVLPICLAYFMK
jgi:hypothetical protein